MSQPKGRKKLASPTKSKHGIDYDLRYEIVPVRKSDYFDQNEVHILLVRWQEQFKLDGKLAVMSKLLAQNIWSFVDGFMHSRIEGFYKFKKQNLDMWEDLRISAYEHLLKTCRYYKYDAILDADGNEIKYKRKTGEARMPRTNAYSFFTFVTRQIVKANTGKYFKQYGNTANTRLNQNEFNEIFYDPNDLFSIGGGKVSTSAHTDEEWEYIAYLDESSDEEFNDGEEYGECDI